MLNIKNYRIKIPKKKKINKTKVESFGELHEVFSKIFEYSRINRFYNIYRGQGNIDWELIPTAGRGAYKKKDDIFILSEWKLQAETYLSFSPKNEWEWLAIAQYHGLATRLLDWTYNPLNAAYFAVKDDIKNDAVIYAYSPTELILPAKTNPFSLDGINVYKPRHLIPRINRQMGIFTVHNKPHVSLIDAISGFESLEIIIIDKKYRKKLLKELYNYGINNSNLFPDLDGLSDEINWKVLNYDN